ncbi:hypothetical protein ACIQYS_10305 [Psychrobacillus sp. NPDC096426]|uniref:hypothetical protein n=1 Tax=Psychrobacillus sp. NPDC096426 TaxID=3364491 RepID=UPI0038140065
MPAKNLLIKKNQIKRNQIGRVKTEKPTNPWGRDENGKLTFVRVLKPGETPLV